MGHHRGNTGATSGQHWGNTGATMIAAQSMSTGLRGLRVAPHTKLAASQRCAAAYRWFCKPGAFGGLRKPSATLRLNIIQGMISQCYRNRPPVHRGKIGVPPGQHRGNIGATPGQRRGNNDCCPADVDRAPWIEGCLPYKIGCPSTQYPEVGPDWPHFKF